MTTNSPAPSPLASLLHAIVSADFDTRQEHEEHYTELTRYMSDEDEQELRGMLRAHYAAEAAKLPPAPWEV